MNNYYRQEENLVQWLDYKINSQKNYYANFKQTMTSLKI